MGHLAPAVGTVKQSSQRIGRAVWIAGLADSPLQTVGKLPRFLVHDGLMGVPENHQFLRLGLAPLLGLVVLADGLAQHGMPHVLLLFQDVGNRRTRPEAGVIVAVAVVVLRVVLLCVCGGYQYLVLGQCPGDGLNTFPLNHHLEDAAHNGGGLLVHNQVLLVLRVAAVAIGDAPRTPKPLLHA